MNSLGQGAAVRSVQEADAAKDAVAGGNDPGAAAVAYVARVTLQYEASRVYMSTQVHAMKSRSTRPQETYGWTVVLSKAKSAV